MTDQIKTKPIVTVLLPVAGSDYESIKSAIDSILNQTLKNILLICIVDEPDDEYLKKLILSYESHLTPKVIVLLNENKQGIAESLNRAAMHVNSKYIARMDADDFSLTNRLQLQYDFMEQNPNISLLGMQAMEVDDNNAVIGITKKPLTNKEVTDYARHACPLIHPTWFIRTEVFQKVGGYMNIAPSQDYHFISKLIKMGYEIGNLDRIGLKYSINSQSVSRKNLLTTLEVSNLIRKSLTKDVNNDILIQMKIKQQRKSMYFEFLYNARTVGLKSYKSDIFVIKFLSLFIIFIPSLLHRILFRDTFELMNIQLLRWRQG